jgi:hypothetical protein
MKANGILVAVCAVGAALMVGAPAAVAKNGDVRVVGKCSAASAVKLKLSPDNGQIEIELEVDQNRNGVRWTVVLKRNGRSVASLARLTKAPSGSFTARKAIANGAGRDVVVATARRAGEVCSARATLAG